MISLHNIHVFAEGIETVQNKVQGEIRSTDVELLVFLFNIEMIFLDMNLSNRSEVNVR